MEPAWQSPLFRDHPLVGRVFDVRGGRFVGPAALRSAVQRGKLVLLGETHDNPDHHQLQAELVRAITAGGRRPALAFEMLDPAEQGAVDAALSGSAPTPDDLRRAVDWDRSGWPPFALYRPIFEAGLSAHLPIVAANLSSQAARGVLHHGPAALDPAVRDLLARAGPPSPGEAAERRQEMEDLHCGQLPEAFLDPMVLAQRARDAQLAESVLRGATADGAVLITGAEHARQDRGVGMFLRAGGATRSEVISVAFREVDPAARGPEDYRPLPYDFVVFTPAADRGDPCRGMRPASGPLPEQRASAAEKP